MRMDGARALIVAAALAATLLLGGCGCSSCGGGGGGTPVPPQPVVKPDFALVDVNPNSGTHQASVSPRQHLTRVSAWYFGHAT